MAQPSIPGTDIGKYVMPYGSDGNNWIALLVSNLGRLKVELASLPTGAVTIADGSDVTLGALADAVVAAGATGSVSAKLRRLTTDLDALLTELKLKADLTETQPVSAASLPLPALASTSTLQGTIITALQSIQNLVGALHDVGLDELDVQVITTVYPGLGSLEKGYQTGAVASSATYTEVLNVSGPGILEGLEFSTNYLDTDLRITVDSDLLRIIHQSGGSSAMFSPSKLNVRGGDSFWMKEMDYDAGNNEFCFYMKRALHYKDTLLIQVRQESGSAKNVACEVYYRLLA